MLSGGTIFNALAHHILQQQHREEIKLALPRYVVFKSEYNAQYLSYRKDDKYLSFTGASVLSPESKFAIEVATIGNGQLVHVRSCYNNKYFVLHSLSGFIVAEAAKPETDTSKDTCTLFEPILVHDVSDNIHQSIRFRHVQTGNFVDVSTFFSCICALSASEGRMMEVINWDSLVMFPSHGVAFKGSNGRYLGGVIGDVDRQFQQFSVDDKSEDLASYIVYPASNGNVQVYSRYFQKYWSVGLKGWIWADRAFHCPDDPDPETVFTPIKIDSNTIALRSVANDKVLRLLDMDGKILCLNACATTISDPTRIRVEELVISRSVYNIVYRQEDARIYDDTPIVCGTGVATNDSNQEDTMTILIEYTEAKSTSWENSISLSLGVSTTIKVGVPLIAGGEIKFDATITGGHKWGEIVDASFKTGTKYTAKIGAKKQVKVSYVASKGTCDVPFSYTQEDVFTDGTRKVTVHDDGMFTGINCYNYSFNKQEDPL